MNPAQLRELAMRLSLGAVGEDLTDAELEAVVAALYFHADILENTRA